MYYKKRKMDASNKNQSIFNRIGQLPVSKAITDKAVSTYESVKHHNRLFTFALQLSENLVKYASETAPAKLVLENRITGSANQIAVNTFDKVEHNFPVVKKTPDELLKMAQKYYNESWLKPKVDTILAVKNYAIAKVTDTKTYCQSLVTGTMDEVLNYTESIVDKYLVYGEANGQAAACGPDASYYKRVKCISGKAYYGLKNRATDYYDGVWAKLKKE